jgi:hypothetical protein
MCMLFSVRACALIRVTVARVCRICADPVAMHQHQHQSASVEERGGTSVRESSSLPVSSVMSRSSSSWCSVASMSIGVGGRRSTRSVPWIA